MFSFEAIQRISLQSHSASVWETGWYQLENKMDLSWIMETASSTAFTTFLVVHIVLVYCWLG